MDNVTFVHSSHFLCRCCEIGNMYRILTQVDFIFVKNLTNINDYDCEFVLLARFESFISVGCITFWMSEEESSQTLALTFST